MTHLEAAFGEFRRVLRNGGHVVAYQMFATDLLEAREADQLFAAMGVVATSADPEHAEKAVAAVGLRVESCIRLSSEWGEYAEEHGTAGRHLLHAARLLRRPDGYIERFGRRAYDIALGDCLWHAYRMVGKLSPRIYVLSAP